MFARLLCLGKGAHRRCQLLGIMDSGVGESPFRGPSLRRGLVGGGDVTVRTFVHLESRQGLEDFATSVVLELDAKVIVQVIVPQRVHIIEETKIAYDDKV